MWHLLKKSQYGIVSQDVALHLQQICLLLHAGKPNICWYHAQSPLAWNSPPVNPSGLPTQASLAGSSGWPSCLAKGCTPPSMTFMLQANMSKIASIVCMTWQPQAHVVSLGTVANKCLSESHSFNKFQLNTPMIADFSDLVHGTPSP